MLKKIFGIIFVLLIASVIFTAAFYITQRYILNRFEDSTTDNIEISNEPKFTLVTDQTLGVRLTVSKLKPTLIYNPNQENTLKDVGISNNFEIMTNGGFFLEGNEYAGALIIDGEIISQSAPLDTQLSHVVTFDSKDNSYEFIETSNFDIGGGYELAFQTGPLMIENNIVQNDFIDNSVNGSGEYLRTFFGTTSDGEVISGITTKKISLEDLSTYLLGLEIFKGKEITIINLDGGSSVALFLGESNSNNFGQYKVLPVLLGFN